MVAVQLSIAGSRHFAHAAQAKVSKDFILAEFVAGRERHVLDSAKCS